MYLFYSFILLFYFVALLPVIAYKRLRYRKPLGTSADRFGYISEAVNPNQEPSIWIHAVSVGEVLAARALLQDLRQHYPNHRLVISTTTVTGREVAEQLQDSVDSVFYAPLDFSWFVTRALDRVVPEMVVFIDTEIWPNWLLACRRRGVRTVIVNARISDRSYRRYRIVQPFMKRALANLDFVCAQTQSWGQRFVELGFPSANLVVTGSLKFDALGPVATGTGLDVGNPLLGIFGFTENRQVLMAASTLKGEEQPVLKAFQRIQEADDDAILIVVPRHPERAQDIVRLAEKMGFEVMLRSALTVQEFSVPEVVVVDSIGELPWLFQFATVVFVGGSLVPAGGHNILEPAVFGKPIVFGPYMENFLEISELFLRRSAAIQVSSASFLQNEMVGLMADPVRCARVGDAARLLVEEEKGARIKTLAAIVELLPSENPNLGHHNSKIRIVL